MTNANLPAGSSVVYIVTGDVATGTTGTIGNSALAVVGAPATDPTGTNNSVLLEVGPAANDQIFADGFEVDVRGLRLTPVAASVRGRKPSGW
jgi:hypothetical protein